MEGYSGQTGDKIACPTPLGRTTQQGAKLGVMGIEVRALRCAHLLE